MSLPTLKSATAPADQPEHGGSPGSYDLIPIRLRVGISGHRNVSADHPSLTTEITKAIEYITQALAADSAAVKQKHIALTAVSSLAEGADRVVASEFLHRQARLEVVLPLPEAEYCKDFGSEESIAEFDRLLKKCPADRRDVVAPTGSREQAYELAGRAVVDRSDAMIVVWDGQPARGRGGTADIYAYAQRWQKPILLIRVDERTARLDTEQLPRRARGTLPLPADSLQRLYRYNSERLRDTMTSGPLLDEDEAEKETRPWPKPQERVKFIDHISGYFARADSLAKWFQKKWFLASRSLYALAPLAVLVVAAQIQFAPSHEIYAWIEFGILVLVILLLVATRRAHWHTRWLSSRYLAEQIRSLVFLGLTGIITPERSASSSGSQAVGEASWTERAAMEIWYARPRYQPPDDIGLLIEVLYEQWIKKQLDYHTTTSKTYRKRSNVMQAVAIGLFSLSAGAALLHSLGAGSRPAQPFRWWDFLAIVIPAVGGAFAGYGAQRDYARHAERSRLFASRLEDARDKLLDARNLRDVQQAALGVSRLMREEAADWYSVVHSQELELPS
ncbi:MAG: hypothetical protein ACLPN6_28480 [Streptosporangiaceae bacterium]|jgi:hypothetical protein|nr:hypothetical protein [Actinomycetota bacterium]